MTRTIPLHLHRLTVAIHAPDNDELKELLESEVYELRIEPETTMVYLEDREDIVDVLKQLFRVYRVYRFGPSRRAA